MLQKKIELPKKISWKEGMSDCTLFVENMHFQWEDAYSPNYFGGGEVSDEKAALLISPSTGEAINKAYTLCGNRLLLKNKNGATEEEVNQFLADLAEKVD